MDFTRIYEELNGAGEDQRLAAFVKEYRASNGGSGGYFHLGSTVEDLFSERKLLSDEEDDFLGKLIAYCIADAFGLKEGVSDLAVDDDSRYCDGYMYDVYDPAHDFEAVVGINGSFEVAAYNAEGKADRLFSTSLEEMMAPDFPSRFMAEFSDAIRGIDAGEYTYHEAVGFDSTMELAMDYIGRPLPEKLLANRLISHIPTGEEADRYYAEKAGA